MSGYSRTTTILRDDTSIGWEFDLINEIQIYNNLRFFVGGGFLIAGNAMDVAMGTPNVNGYGKPRSDEPLGSQNKTDVHLLTRV